MFGHDDETQDNSTTQNDTAAQDSLAAQTNTAFTNTSDNNDSQLNIADSADTGINGSAAPSDPVKETLSDATDNQEDTPLLSQTGTADDAVSSPDETDEATDDDTNEDNGSADSSVATETASNASPVDEDLIELKKQSLEELAPLVDHLDQTAEEKFRTTMMMIQATDNSSLIKDAHTAALKITDDKVRAQALLDIVNEINYFTQIGSAKTDNQ